MNREKIEEIAKVLVDYTKKKHIMASHVILEEYAEEIYKADYRKQSEVAEEIFAEIHQRLDSNIESCKVTAILTDSKRAKEDYEIVKRILIDVRHYIAKLKKKYTEGHND